ncbi:MAG TPA: hypothetical protein HPQ04_13215 [Rhodospirillaceae bacterium]|nr:hypothetical protein [Rhodospirillaceae bacterium]
MALSGIPALVDGLVSGLTGIRSSSGPRARGVEAVDGASGQSTTGDSRSQRQYVNVEGRVLDRAAPRGTYLNITA